MVNAKAITEFLRKSVRNLGIFSLILAALEQLLDDQFICPCERVYNVVTCVLYAVVPSIACFFFTWFVEDGKMKDNSVCCKLLYSILAVLVWLCIFFFDGRYLACGLSYWRSVYAEGTLQGSELTFKWCKPSGPVNEVPYAETQEKTLKWM
ncbi:hypothetical protein PGIGA_G00172260, partial [Pangasianodon gigas]|nr:hypothetical protein [Pangasianodon gigas]